MMIEIGSNLFHATVFFIIVWGITRFFAVLGGVAAGQRRIKPPVKPIEFTK